MKTHNLTSQTTLVISRMHGERENQFSITSIAPITRRAQKQLLINTLLVAASLLLSTLVLGNDNANCDYNEDFRHPPKNWTCGAFAVKWQTSHPGYHWDGKAGHDTNGCLRVTEGESNPTRFWYDFGSSKPVTIHIEFWYLQFNADKDAVLEYQFSTDDACNFPKSGYSKADDMTISGDWTKESYELSVPDDKHAVYWQFRRKTPSKVSILVDELTVTSSSAAAKKSATRHAH
ncbi:MAG TPA: hypothetical protein VLT36_06945 [Candidatus Dormibacteraeota bacterium]|nr:hypothetical protein [Candidatus Dormibacteraeota bacterium]